MTNISVLESTAGDNANLMRGGSPACRVRKTCLKCGKKLWPVCFAHSAMAADMACRQTRGDMILLKSQVTKKHLSGGTLIPVE